MKWNRKQLKRNGLLSGRLVKRFAKRRVSILAVVVITGCTLGLAVRAYSRRSGEPVAAATSSSNLSATTLQSPFVSSIFSRLRLRAEADGMRRRIGQRFSAPGREVSVLLGTLTVMNDQRPVRITRAQDGDGEQVEVAIIGEPLAQRWDSDDGAKAGASPGTPAQRSIIERLALDSPDQFIFAQLRGAAYYTVARNIRPGEAGDSDDYDGPIWDIVRVVESTSLSKNKPQSPWRLYYINSSTGLIDKVLSQEEGENVIAQLSSWVNQGGELFPTRITWATDKQVLMELNISNISLNAR